MNIPQDRSTHMSVFLQDRPHLQPTVGHKISAILYDLITEVVIFLVPDAAKKAERKRHKTKGSCALSFPLCPLLVPPARKHGYQRAPPTRRCHGRTCVHPDLLMEAGGGGGGGTHSYEALTMVAATGKPHGTTRGGEAAAGARRQQQRRQILVGGGRRILRHVGAGLWEPLQHLKI